MRRILNLILQAFFFFAPFQISQAASKIIPTVPHEYQILEKAQLNLNSKPISLQQIQNHQNQLKHLEWNTINKSLEKEAEDLYWFYEIRKAEKIGRDVALVSWIKALNSLHPFKWIYGWTRSTSEALTKHCKVPQKSSKRKISPSPAIEEKCLYLGRKVLEAFPKSANETASLREWIKDTPTLEAATERFERLSQGYGEKIEKDEVAFNEVLDAYLNRRDSDLFSSGKKFVDEYPKSMLRFRALFLMAERYFAKGDQIESSNLYQQIIQYTPYSFYALVSAERLGSSLKEKIIKDPLKIGSDLSAFKLNFLEKESLIRLQNLIAAKKPSMAALEFEQFTRARIYPTEFLLYLIRLANQSKQDLAGFRFASEILQRRNEVPLNQEFVDMIFPDRFAKEIADHSKQSKVDPLLVVSLMKQESGFKDGILSSSGAAGLMQLMPFTAIEVQKDLELKKLREPMKNIEIGTRYLGGLLNEKFNGNIVYALAGYNAGPQRVSKWRKEAKPEWGMIEFIEAIPFKETRDYVMSILRNRYWYQYRRGLPQQSVFEAWRSP